MTADPVAAAIAGRRPIRAFRPDPAARGVGGHLLDIAATQPIGRMGRPEEVADLALFLCSDEASFITGSDYPLDGGFIRLNS